MAQILKLLYLFIVTILCMKEAYKWGGAIFSTFIGSIGAMLMVLLAFSSLGVISAFKKCIKKKYHQMLFENSRMQGSKMKAQESKYHYDV